jgi:hypothetical protein
MVRLRVGSSGALPSSAYSADVRLHLAFAALGGITVLRRLPTSGLQFALHSSACG